MYLAQFKNSFDMHMVVVLQLKIPLPPRRQKTDIGTEVLKYIMNIEMYPAVINTQQNKTSKNI